MLQKIHKNRGQQASQKAIFILEQYFVLSAVLIAILGWGRIATVKLLLQSSNVSALTNTVLQATTGLGLITLLSLFLAATGALTAAPILAIIVIGIILFLFPLIRTFTERKLVVNLAGMAQLGWLNSILVFMAAAAFLSNSLVRPLNLPLGWDELAYHLPTAQAWAHSGELLITDWLRYPLFPFNMQLLYAGALVLATDMAAHLVHALTGLLSVALAFSLARVHMPAVFAVLAAVFLVYAIREPLETADIDLGLTLYIFSAFSALAVAFLEKRKNLVYLAAFFVGLALGTKYQAMFFLPSLVICFLMVERNWKSLSVAAVVAITT